MNSSVFFIDLFKVGWKGRAPQGKGVARRSHVWSFSECVTTGSILSVLGGFFRPRKRRDVTCVGRPLSDGKSSMLPGGMSLCVSKNPLLHFADLNATLHQIRHWPCATFALWKNDRPQSESNLSLQTPTSPRYLSSHRVVNKSGKFNDDDDDDLLKLTIKKAEKRRWEVTWS